MGFRFTSCDLDEEDDSACWDDEKVEEGMENEDERREEYEGSKTE